MLLKNFSYGLVSCFLGLSESNDRFLTNTNGTKVGLQAGYAVSRDSVAVVNSGTIYNGNHTNWSSQYTFFAIVYGDGTTPPTVDDYTLSGNLITDLSASDPDIQNAGNGITFSHVVENTGTSAVTISEISLALEFSQTVQARYGVALLTRDVLETPITLEPGARRNISVFINSNSFVEGAA